MATAVTTNDYIKGHEKNTKDIDTLNKRISDIVANNGNGTKDVEIVDARRGKASLGDRIDDVENKIAINNDEISKETKDARVDFDGGIHKNLNLRLLEDFNNLYKLFYNSTLLEYEGQYITAEKSYKGIAEDMQVKGGTLQNLLKLVRTDILVQYGAIATWHLYKNNTVYTIIVTNKGTEAKQLFLNGSCFTAPIEFTVQPTQTSVIKATTLPNFTEPQYAIEVLLKNRITHTQPNNLAIVVLEGDWTNKEIPQHFEGIRSVEEKAENLEVVSCGKNLLGGLIENKEYTATGTTTATNFLTDYIKVDSGNNYILSAYVKDTLPFVDTSGNAILRIDIYDGNKNVITNKGIKGNVTTEYTRLFSDVIVLPSNAKYIRINFRHANGSVGTVKNIQLEANAMTTVYEQYKEHRQAILLTEPLRGLPNGVNDIIDFDKSKLIRNVGKVVLNGNENLIKADAYSTTTHTCFICKNTGASTNEPFVGISSHFIFRSVTNVRDEEGIQFGGATPYGDIYIRIANTKLTTTDSLGFKAWLQANPTTVYYQLATPTETPIDLVPPRTNELITYLFTEGSLIEPTIKTKVPSNIPAKIQTLSLQNQALHVENTNLRSVVEESTLSNLENSINQEKKITMLELGVI